MAREECERLDWRTISEAAGILGIPVRTIYGWLQRGVLRHRDIEGTRHVSLSEAQTCAAASAAASASSNTRGKGDSGASAAAARQHGPEPEPLRQARTRAAVMEATAAELGATRSARRIEQQLVQEEADRTVRRQQVELDTEKGRLELEQMRWLHEHERARAEAEAKEAERQQQVSARERARRLEREQAERETAERRTRWERVWAADVAQWTAQHLGVGLVDRAVECARRALVDCDVDDEHARVVEAIDMRLQIELADELADADRRKAEDELRVHVNEAVARADRVFGDVDLVRVRTAAEASARGLDPCDSSTKDAIQRAATQECKRIRQEQLDRERETREAAAERERERRSNELWAVADLGATMLAALLGQPPPEPIRPASTSADQHSVPSPGSSEPSPDGGKPRQ